VLPATRRSQTRWYSINLPRRDGRLIIIILLLCWRNKQVCKAGARDVPMVGEQAELTDLPCISSRNSWYINLHYNNTQPQPLHYYHHCPHYHRNRNSFSSGPPPYSNNSTCCAASLVQSKGNNLASNFVSSAEGTHVTTATFSSYPVTSKYLVFSYREMYTVSQKKEATKLSAITCSNLNRFSKFFHC